MPMLEWSDTLSVNIGEIDGQHKGLIGIINQIHDSIKVDAVDCTAFESLEKMRNYTIYHFYTEERYMEDHGYPRAGRHKAEHQEFIDQVARFENRCKAGNPSVSMDVLNFLSNWLVTHINGTDKKLGAYLNEKGIR